MFEGATRDALWSAAHAERAALADDLAGLDDAQWAQPSLCGRWVIEEVVAHLTAAASMGPLRWFASALGAHSTSTCITTGVWPSTEAEHPPRRSSGSGVSSPAPPRHWDRPPHG
jgi:uncharacterized protein (TIGR03083 family)